MYVRYIYMYYMYIAGKWDPSKFNVYEVLKANAINMELAIQVYPNDMT